MNKFLQLNATAMFLTYIAPVAAVDKGIWQILQEDVNSIINKGQTALMHAAREGYTKYDTGTAGKRRRSGWRRWQKCTRIR